MPVFANALSFTFFMEWFAALSPVATASSFARIVVSGLTQ
jgi:hypothetical protein